MPHPDLTEIEAVVTEMDDTDAQLWEINENLHRADLSVAERALHIAEWIRITGEKSLFPAGKNEPLDPIGRPNPQPPGSGTRGAAKALGIHEMEAYRAVKISTISPEAMDAAIAGGLAPNQLSDGPIRHARILRQCSQHTTRPTRHGSRSGGAGQMTTASKQEVRGFGCDGVRQLNLRSSIQSPQRMRLDCHDISTALHRQN
jgi:hypothetical protein